jgi:hypothetical protein
MAKGLVKTAIHVSVLIGKWRRRKRLLDRIGWLIRFVRDQPGGGGIRPSWTVRAKRSKYTR